MDAKISFKYIFPVLCCVALLISLFCVCLNISFLQFSANASRAGQSSPICGRISRNENWNEKNVTDPRLQRSYFNADGTIHLYFYSENWDDQDEEQDVGDDESHQEIGVEIVFSSYTGR